MGLRVRKKKNKSGSVSIVIVDRANRGYKVIETIGYSKNKDEIESLYQQALKRIDELEQNLFSTIKDRKIKQLKELLLQITNENLLPIGDELIYGKLFEQIGCNIVFDNIKNIRKKSQKLFLFKSLVISRLLYPGSKLYLIDYLHYFKHQDIEKDRIYRFLDNLYNKEIKQIIEKCVYNHTLKIIDNDLIVSFYDVTTLHFENESEDDLRKIGYSKEGKLNRPQIQLGLLTTVEGYPLAYEVYEGNKFEGHTLIDILKQFQETFQIKHKPIVVADKGMLSNCNLIELSKSGYKYIIGARIKALPNVLKKQISNLVFLNDMDTKEIKLDEELICKEKRKVKDKAIIRQRLILSYSTQRAKKDSYLRQKALKQLKHKIEKSNNITKSDLKSPYLKFLDLDKHCKIEFKLNKEKIAIDEKLDGIKGYITNDFSLKHQDIIQHYKNLWHIEKAFRISKTDLEIRPIYHSIEHRIKAHILIAFVAYAIYMEFERKLRLKNIKLPFSRKILRDLIKHMFAIKINDETIPLNLSEIQQKIYDTIYS
jgi:transposase